MDHLGDLVPHVARLLHALVLRGQLSCAYKDIPHTDLATAIALPVERSEAFHERAALFGLSAHEDAVVRDVDIIENDEGFLATVAGVAQVERAALQLARVGGLTAQDEGHTVGVGRDRERDRVVFPRLRASPWSA